MANPIFEKVKRERQANSPLGIVLGKIKEFRAGFGKEADPQQMAQNYMEKNNFNADQVSYIKNMAEQAASAGIVSKNDLEAFKKMLGG